MSEPWSAKTSMATASRMSALECRYPGNLSWSETRVASVVAAGPKKACR